MSCQIKKFEPLGPSWPESEARVGSSPYSIAIRTNAVLAGWLFATVLVAPGCSSNPEVMGRASPTAPPPRTFTGPPFLRGTIGSLSHLDRASYMPQLVGGIGLVVLPPGSRTGSTTVPADRKQWLIQLMRRMRVGTRKHGFPKTPSPERMLTDPDTAVVVVEGYMPPAATKGAHFDVLVSVLDGTDATSLANGRLWTTDLSVDGTNRTGQFSRPLARARGPIYLNPFDDRSEQEKEKDFVQSAMIVSGGEVTVDQPLQLVLNESSYGRSRLISDRINERYGRPTDLKPIANSKSDLIIELRVPPRWANQTDLFLDLIGHLYIERNANFTQRKARDLAKVLADNPQYTLQVMMAWRAMGRTIYPVLRQYYDDQSPHLKLAALEAGAWLEDERASEFLQIVAKAPDPRLRTRAAAALVYLPRSLRGERTLKTLLNDPDRSVRIAAYESLAVTRPQWLNIERAVLHDEAGPKFIIDRVPATNPLIYVTQERDPRIVVFGRHLSFVQPTLARLWDNRLMLRIPTTIYEALFGIEVDQTAILPIERRGEIIRLKNEWVVDLFDKAGHTVKVRITGEELKSQAERLIQVNGETPATVTIRLIQAGDPAMGQLRSITAGQDEFPLSLFYQPQGWINPNDPEPKPKSVNNIYPSVAALAYMLGHKPTAEAPNGLDLTYSQVVDVLYHLCQQGHIPAPFEARVSPLAALLRESREAQTTRPETGTTREIAPALTTTPSSNRLETGTDPQIEPD